MLTPCTCNTCQHCGSTTFGSNRDRAAAQQVQVAPAASVATPQVPAAPVQDWNPIAMALYPNALTLLAVMSSYA